MNIFLTIAAVWAFIAFSLLALGCLSLLPILPSLQPQAFADRKTPQRPRNNHA